MVSTQLSQGGPPVEFSPTSSYPSGNNAYSLTAHDLNSDRRIDLVVANANSDLVSILLGATGDGSFSTASNYQVGFGPLCAAVGDINNDGKLDLVLGSQGTNGSNVLMGSGDGSFVLGPDYPRTSPVHSVALNDFNGDGFLDLATANPFSNTVSVLLGNGAGLFTNQTDYVVGASPMCVVVADFNQDGKADLAVANRAGHNVTFLPGIGNGTFGPKVNFNTGAGPFHLTTGDLNHDGISDVVTANYDGASITVLLGTTNDSFIHLGTYPVGPNPRSVALADFDGDGNLDVLTANETAPGTLSLLLGTAGGSLGQWLDFTVANFPTAVSTGDFNRDGRQDLAMAYGNAVGIRLNETQPTLQIFGLTNAHAIRWSSWRAMGLQSTTNALLQDGWEFMPELPVQSGDQKVLIRPNDAGKRFYRLKTLTPPMGFNSWFNYGTLISETIGKRIADALVTNGYAKLGYRYLNLDDGWASKERDANGDIIAYTNKFTNGSLQTLADYVHQQGLLFGVYTESGPQIYTSAGTGLTSWGSYDRDALKYAQWKVDYVKCDGPGGIDISDPSFRQLRENFAAALRNTGRKMFINSSVSPIQPWMIDSHNSIRQLQFGDVVSYSILVAWLDEIWKHKEEYGPGFWPDLDALSWPHLSEQQHRTQFIMSCMISGLLLLAEVPGPYGGKYCTNGSMIAINQDPAGIVANKTWSNALAEVWSKPLGSKDSLKRAVALMNRSFATQSITMYWTNIGLPAGVATVKDLSAQSIIGYFTNQFTTNVLANSVEAYQVMPGVIPVLPAGTNYLGDIFWGPNATHTPERVIGKNFVPSEAYVNYGPPIQLQGTVYPKGLSFTCETFPNSISYFLGKQASVFHATIGHDDSTTNVASGSISVRFFVNDTKVFDTNFSPQSIPVTTNLNLSQAQVFTIQVLTNTPPGNGFLDLADSYFVIP